jgi:hypothetical protein
MTPKDVSGKCALTPPVPEIDVGWVVISPCQ